MSAPGEHRIEYTVASRRDLRDVARFMMEERGADAAATLVRAIDDRVQALRIFPLRGAVPKEAFDIGNTDLRQIIFRQYRIIYTVGPTTVSILLIADGRRDMRALLRERGLARDAPSPV